MSSNAECCTLCGDSGLFPQMTIMSMADHPPDEDCPDPHKQITFQVSVSKCPACAGEPTGPVLGPLEVHEPSVIPPPQLPDVIQLCPVCEGRGHVPLGFYLDSPFEEDTAVVRHECCRTCGGQGVLWIKKAYEAVIRRWPHLGLDEVREPVGSDLPTLKVGDLKTLLRKQQVPDDSEIYVNLGEANALMDKDGHDDGIPKDSFGDRKVPIHNTILRRDDKIILSLPQNWTR